MAARGYDPYEEASLKSLFKSAFGYDVDDELSGVNPLTPDYYANTAVGSSATVIPGLTDDLDQDADYTTKGNTGPAPLTDIPTSSTNAQRPRTVAAGYQLYAGEGNVPYEQRKGKLTVMFRDGTLYNFYDVSPEEWILFKGQLSKGPMLNWKPAPGFLLEKDHGPADLSQVSSAAQKTIQRIARTAQVRYAHGTAESVLKSSQARYAGQITPGGAQRAKRALRSKGYGKNPNANRGKNPS